MQSALGGPPAKLLKRERKERSGVRERAFDSTKILKIEQNLSNTPEQTSGHPPTEHLARAKADNRKKYPELAQVVDQLRAVFGQDQVKVVRITEHKK